VGCGGVRSRASGSGTKRHADPQRRQLVVVLASASLHSRLTVRALNGVEEWGPSDHCRVQIDLAEPSWSRRA
jgi:hypothetical protein